MLCFLTFTRYVLNSFHFFLDAFSLKCVFNWKHQVVEVLSRFHYKTDSHRCSFSCCNTEITYFQTPTRSSCLSSRGFIVCTYRDLLSSVVVFLTFRLPVCTKSPAAFVSNLTLQAHIQQQALTAFLYYERFTVLWTNFPTVSCFPAAINNSRCQRTVQSHQQLPQHGVLFSFDSTGASQTDLSQFVATTSNLSDSTRPLKMHLS